MRIYYDKTDGVPVLGYNTVYRLDPSDATMRPVALLALTAKRPGALPADLGHWQESDPVKQDDIAAARDGVTATMGGSGDWIGYTVNPEPDANRRERLAGIASSASLAGKVAVVDPLGSVAPANIDEYADYLARRGAAWEMPLRDPATPGATVTALSAADTQERDWAEAQGLVVRKINADVYTTDNDVTTAVEWP